MRIRTLTANILLPASIAVAIVAESLIRHAVHAFRRRTRPSRHRRAQVRPNPKTRKAT